MFARILYRSTEKLQFKINQSNCVAAQLNITMVTWIKHTRQRPADSVEIISSFLLFQQQPNEFTFSVLNTGRRKMKVIEVLVWHLGTSENIFLTGEVISWNYK